jgi:hypothetical protein
VTRQLDEPRPLFGDDETPQPSSETAEAKTRRQNRERQLRHRRRNGFMAHLIESPTGEQATWTTCR